MEVLNHNETHSTAKANSSGGSPALLQDPLRLTLRVTGLGLSGFEAATRLEQEHSVVVELATAQVCPVATGEGGGGAL